MWMVKKKLFSCVALTALTSLEKCRVEIRANLNESDFPVNTSVFSLDTRIFIQFFCLDLRLYTCTLVNTLLSVTTVDRLFTSCARPQDYGLP